MKKGIVFFLAAAVLLCFAVPAIASPPGSMPALAAVGQSVNTNPGIPVSEAVLEAYDSSGLVLSALQGFVPVREGSLVSYVSEGKAPMLAGLMRAALGVLILASIGRKVRLGFDPRMRMTRFARDQP